MHTIKSANLEFEFVILVSMPVWISCDFGNRIYQQPVPARYDQILLSLHDSFFSFIFQNAHAQAHRYAIKEAAFVPVALLSIALQEYKPAVFVLLAHLRLIFHRHHAQHVSMAHSQTAPVQPDAHSGHHVAKDISKQSHPQHRLTVSARQLMLASTIHALCFPLDVRICQHQQAIHNLVEYADLAFQAMYLLAMAVKTT